VCFNNLVAAVDYLRTLDDILSNLPHGILVRCKDEILFANKAAARVFGFNTVRELTDHRAVSARMGTFVQPQTNPEQRFAYFSNKDGDLFFADVTERVIDFRGQQAVQITLNAPQFAKSSIQLAFGHQQSAWKPALMRLIPLASIKLSSLAVCKPCAKTVSIRAV
jgi:hypothetical protein